LFCPNLNPVDYGVWDDSNLQERVYKHHRITGVEEMRQRIKEE